MHPCSRLRPTPEYKAAPTSCFPACCPLYQTLDPDTYGGAILLGVDGVCIISHGSSSARAIVNALQVAKDMVEAGIVAELREAVAPT